MIDFIVKAFRYGGGAKSVIFGFLLVFWQMLGSFKCELQLLLPCREKVKGTL